MRRVAAVDKVEGDGAFSRIDEFRRVPKPDCSVSAACEEIVAVAEKGGRKNGARMRFEVNLDLAFHINQGGNAVTPTAGEKLFVKRSRAASNFTRQRKGEVINVGNVRFESVGHFAQLREKFKERLFRFFFDGVVFRGSQRGNVGG